MIYLKDMLTPPLIKIHQKSFNTLENIRSIRGEHRFLKNRYSKNIQYPWQNHEKDYK